MRWILLMLAVACGHAVTPRPSPSAPAAEQQGLTVTLEWTAAVDLDLYVTDPAWGTVYYARRGGQFGEDARCLADGPSARWERARWTRPPSGRYRVGVDFPEACGPAADSVPYRVIVDLDGVRREIAGTVRLRRRQPLAMEFTVP
jgi:hypothetical protein